MGSDRRHRGAGRDVRPPHRGRAHQGPHQVAPGPPTKPLARGRPDGHTRLAGPRLVGPQRHRPTNKERAGLRQVALAHCLAALLVQLALVEPAGAAPAPGPTHEAYTWFRDHIEEQFRSWHKVSQYADRLGYSTRTLNRLARQHTGLSAKELIDERVVLEAKRQLSHADASVSEIAEQLGFDDASNFSSYFRRQTGMTPGAFRTRSRGLPPDAER